MSSCRARRVDLEVAQQRLRERQLQRSTPSAGLKLVIRLSVRRPRRSPSRDVYDAAAPRQQLAHADVRRPEVGLRALIAGEQVRRRLQLAVALERRLQRRHERALRGRDAASSLIAGS